MPKNYQRTDRIGDLMQTVLAQLIQLEINDPRISKTVTLTGVKVARDLAHANVFFTVSDEKTMLETTLLGLKNASGFLRSRLAEEIELRISPELHFIYDKSLESAKRIDDILTKIDIPE